MVDIFITHPLLYTIEGDSSSHKMLQRRNTTGTQHNNLPSSLHWKSERWFWGQSETKCRTNTELLDLCDGFLLFRKKDVDLFRSCLSLTRLRNYAKIFWVPCSEAKLLDNEAIWPLNIHSQLLYKVLMLTSSGHVPRLVTQWS